MNPTASKLDIYADCRMAGCLPRASTSGDYAAEGNVFHAFLDRVVELQKPTEKDQRQASLEDAREAALLEQPLELRAALARLRLETLALDPSKIATEVAYAYDVRTGRVRELGRRIERHYVAAAVAAGEPLNEYEYCGSLDRAALVGERGGYIGDYKRFGWNLKPAKESWQLRFGALCLARLHKLDHVDVEYIVLGEDGEPYGGVERLEAFDIDAFEAELGTLHQRMEEDRVAFLDGDIPEATLSDRCKYCPGHPYCPARHTFARQLLLGEQKEILAIVDKERPMLIRPEDAPRLWVMKEVGKSVLEDLDRALREVAFTHPFTLPDGKTVGPVPRNVREIANGAKARQVLEELVGPEAAKAGWKTEVPVGTLRDVARLAKPPAGREEDLKTIDAREEWLFEELFTRGAATKREGRIVMVKPAKKAAKTKGA